MIPNPDAVHRRRADVFAPDPFDAVHARLSAIESRLSRLEGGIVLAGFLIGVGVVIAGAIIGAIHP